MKTCGYCINYRVFEDRISPASMSTTLVEFCSLGKDHNCAYANPVCDDYEPDLDYIEFMNDTKH